MALCPIIERFAWLTVLYGGIVYFRKYFTRADQRRNSTFAEKFCWERERERRSWKYLSRLNLLINYVNLFCKWYINLIYFVNDTREISVICEWFNCDICAFFAQVRALNSAVERPQCRSGRAFSLRRILSWTLSRLASMEPVSPLSLIFGVTITVPPNTARRSGFD